MLSFIMTQSGYEPQNSENESQKGENIEASEPSF